MPSSEASSVSIRIITLVVAISCGFLVANIYYSQPLVAVIADRFNLENSTASLVVTLNQLGYGLGLLFLVPLADLVNNKRLVLLLILLAIISLLGFALGQNFIVVFGFALLVGFSCSVVQILVPYVVSLSPEHIRGQVVGNVMSGLMAGILLARPLASFLAGIMGWSAVFYFSAALLILITLLLWWCLPPKLPSITSSYGQILRSMLRLWNEYAILRSRALGHAFFFCAFTLFWTAAPLFLLSDPINLSQFGLALFGFVGAGAVVVTPIAGRLADRGFIVQGTLAAIFFLALSFILMALIFVFPKAAVWLLTLAAISLDVGSCMNLVIGQKLIYGLDAEIRGRLNGLYMVVFFIGGSIGSTIGGMLYTKAGLGGVIIFGFALTLAVFLYFVASIYKGYQKPCERCL